jgi:hypothetical protein
MMQAETDFGTNFTKTLSTGNFQHQSWKLDQLFAISVETSSRQYMHAIQSTQRMEIPFSAQLRLTNLMF